MAIGDHLSDANILWGAAGCADTNKCLLTAAEKGIDTQGVAIDMSSDSDMKKLSEFSPYHSLPVIKDVDFYLYGTEAILSYLDDKGFGDSLVPRNSVIRAQQYQWIHVARDVFAPMVEKLRDGNNETESLRNVLGDLDAQLSSKNKRGDYIVGEFTLADILWTPYIHFCFLYGKGSLIDQLPAVKAWWGHIKTRKSTSKEDYVPFTVLPSMDEVRDNKPHSVSINIDI